jgi:deoxyribonuclease (pyrimidine dimer)
MTRINCTIKPIELSTKHLIAELREIKRIPNHILSSKDNLNMSDIPNKFKLGSGHVKFFYNKLGYLYKRYKLLYDEAKNVRGYNVSDFSESFIKAIELRKDLNNDYIETKEDRIILIERLKERDYEYYNTIK